MGADRRRYVRVPFRGYFESETLYTPDGIEIGEFNSKLLIFDISVGGIGMTHRHSFDGPCIVKGNILIGGTKHKAIVQIERCQATNCGDYTIGGEFINMHRQLNEAIKKHVLKMSTLAVW